MTQIVRQMFRPSASRREMRELGLGNARSRMVGLSFLALALVDVVAASVSLAG